MKNTRTTEFEDEVFIQKESLQCTFFLQTTGKSHRFLILDQQQNIRLLQELETDNLLREKSIYLNLRYKKTLILALPETFVFIPHEFDAEHLPTLHQFLLPKTEDAAFKEKFFNNEITTHFTVNEDILQLQKRLATEHIFPSANILIHKTLTMQAEGAKIIGINFYEEEFELAYVNDNRFIFYNRFPKATADDVNYFLLAVFEQFTIQPAMTAFYLSGEISEGDENYERIRKYTSHIHFMESAKSHLFPKQFDEKRKHRYNLLLELSRCV